ncbi:lipid-A-disaccharide synthase [Sediminitomix flava]|uniref:Lipid-A-disaccharide synthase n=1 Tax=Sediminitomix flava TaxID=379075 RepID=A0A315ZBC9_SEDFL|nr:lipid-A-disaccharide synthase [Sediminitomix flava]PWJ42024.1 lipid-A-disaccharide synthase [Sediminitomix flava]
MKYYIIAGEKSGDLHASNLVKELKIVDPNATFRGCGGDEMQAQGVELLKHYKDMAFMGFLEVVKNLMTIRKNIKNVKKDIAAYQPDVVILVDYSGFNLRIAEFTKKAGIKTYYYISPKVWAWNTGRAKKIKRLVDKMFVIMHFEKEFYKKYDFEVDYVGNPLFDAIGQFEKDEQFLAKEGLGEKPIIAILPGSRYQEVTKILPTMLSVTDKYPDYQFVVAGVKQLPDEVYKEVRERNIKIVFDNTYNLFSYAHAGIITSGTATLETALFDVPQVVCYTTSGVTYAVIKSLIKVKFISLVNLIADKEIVKELIQGEYTSENLKKELDLVLGENRDRILRDYKEMKAKIETEGTSKRTAKLMWQYLNEDKA